MTGRLPARDGMYYAPVAHDFFVCPDNTARIALDAATEPYPLPTLHIADIVAARAKTDGHEHIALLGSRWTRRRARAPDSS